MKKQTFDNYYFKKNQTVVYQEENYDLLGVDFETNKVLIKINDLERWVSYLDIDIIDF